MHRKTVKAATEATRDGVIPADLTPDKTLTVSHVDDTMVLVVSAMTGEKAATIRLHKRKDLRLMATPRWLRPSHRVASEIKTGTETVTMPEAETARAVETEIVIDGHGILSPVQPRIL